MEPDDDATRRKGVGSYGQPAPRDAEATFIYTRHAPLRDRHGGETSLAPAPSLVAWVDGGLCSASSASLDRALSEYGGALPEFVGAGAFRVPLRAAVHPARPPALEVRPHPLRETQVGSFLRTLACDRRQLWAGAECGVRVWPLDEVFFGARCPAARRGDEETAPFRESAPAPPALCVAVDAANRMVWTGHRDGRIRAWRMDQGDAPLFTEAVSWQAFARTPVLSIVVTSDARTRDLLRVFGMDGHVESARLEPPMMPEQFIEEEIKVKPTKKDKPQCSFTFLQKSRNALMGAADAMRRVATKGTLIEDNRRTEAVAQPMDGTIWSGCTNGSIIVWDGNGNKLQEFQHHVSSVQCMETFGERVWVGYASGTIQVMDVEGNLLAGWTAHSCPVIKMAIGGSYIFSLAHHGGIRGWPLSSPGPLDDILRTELANRELSYMRLENIKILVGTWNVAQEKASYESLWSWLGSASPDVGLVVVGLQEVEMGAGALAMAAAKESGLRAVTNRSWSVWIDNIGKTLDEGISFHRVGSRQLAGLLIAAWARNDLKPYVGDVDAAAVPCGFGHAIGNKGGVGLRIRVHDRRICFVNNHFAAHLENVSRRNADFDHIYRTMTFNKPHGSTASTTSVQLPKTASDNQTDEDTPELAEADMVVFLGDFNYRLNGITYDEARDMVSQRSFDWLRERDQLRIEMKAGNVFQGMREGAIKFPPTYKFQRHQPGLAGYDSGEKKRIPAWCDRILYRDSRSVSIAGCSLECPVVAAITSYEACMDVTDSDHKPVRCTFSVDIARVDELTRRRSMEK
ncbi:hypothetical protein PR202_ga21559 [Eleusine coracana subsp. coracana]|uniref:Inositol polyphosphate-related phosphatase domain-containing protein n=1 Tax=Eleusine coracana subsp. coracana TaxID=191504 RepID=A0AAV5CZE3_ELECO|nr:hypothetical protein PR202_ga21559 [Eleusine coracana subsp. coracana]